MLGHTIRTLREEKGWSQAHLAQASCVNIRTIQRLEAGDACSRETLLAIAGALDVDARALIAQMPNGHDTARATPREEARPWPNANRAAAVAALAATPSLLFVGINLLRQLVGISWPYDALASAGAAIMSFETFNALSPFVFFGGTMVAVLLCLAAQLRPRGSFEGGVLSVRGIEVRPSAPPAVVMLLALGSAGALFLYAVAEGVATLAAR